MDTNVNYMYQYYRNKQYKTVLLQSYHGSPDVGHVSRTHDNRTVFWERHFALVMNDNLNAGRFRQRANVLALFYVENQ